MFKANPLPTDPPKSKLRAEVLKGKRWTLRFERTFTQLGFPQNLVEEENSLIRQGSKAGNMATQLAWPSLILFLPHCSGILYRESHSEPSSPWGKTIMCSPAVHFEPLRREGLLRFKGCRKGYLYFLLDGVYPNSLPLRASTLALLFLASTKPSRRPGKGKAPRT